MVLNLSLKKLSLLSFDYSTTSHILPYWENFAKTVPLINAFVFIK